MASHVTCLKESQGLALEYYRSYNLSWYDPTQYITNVGQARHGWIHLNPPEIFSGKSEENQSKKCTFLFSFGSCQGEIHPAFMMWRLWCEVPTLQLQVASHAWIIFASQVDMAMLKTCAEVCRGVQMSSIAWAVWCVDFLSPAFVSQD